MKVYDKFKHIEFPQLVCIGPNMLNDIPNVFEKLKLGKEIVIITDEFLKTRIAKDVENVLVEGIKGANVVISTIKDSTLEEVDKQLSIIKDTRSSVIIGLGGGKPIDVAKLTSYKANLRFVSVPTVCSHDGVASARASLKGINKRHSIEARPPIAVIADTKILDEAPYRYTAAGCGDVLAKKTATKDWLLAHRLKYEPVSEYSIALSEMTVTLITRNADVIASKVEGFSRIVIKALISSSLAMCVAGSSRPASGSEHLFSHALDQIAEKPALHGEQCAIGTIMMAYLHDLNWEEIKEIMVKIGLPTTAKELGVKDEEIVKALEIAHTIRPERFTILGESGLTHEAAVAVAETTGVI